MCGFGLIVGLMGRWLAALLVERWGILGGLLPGAPHFVRAGRGWLVSFSFLLKGVPGETFLFFVGGVWGTLLSFLCRRGLGNLTFLCAV